MPPESSFAPAGQLVEAVVSEVSFRRNFEYSFEREPPSYTLDVRSTATVASDHSEGMAELRAVIEWNTDGDRLAEPFQLEVTITGFFAMTVPDASEGDIVGCYFEFYERKPDLADRFQAFLDDRGISLRG